MFQVGMFCWKPAFQVVLLDEPTSGLDFDSRQSVQSLLLSEKANKSIIVTTHYMDEADILGDHVVMMANGRSVDQGSTRVLKRKYGNKPRGELPPVIDKKS